MARKSQPRELRTWVVSNNRGALRVKVCTHSNGRHQRTDKEQADKAIELACGDGRLAGGGVMVASLEVAP